MPDVCMRSSIPCLRDGDASRGFNVCHWGNKLRQVQSTRRGKDKTNERLIS